MKTCIRSVVALAIAITSLACSDSTGVDPEDLEGTWNATVAVVINAANSAQTEHLIALGLAITVELRRDGTVTATFDDGAAPDVEMGTLAVVGSDLTLVLESNSYMGSISRDGDRMSMTLINGIDWDFDNDGVDLPATIRLELVRVS